MILSESGTAFEYCLMFYLDDRSSFLTCLWRNETFATCWLGFFTLMSYWQDRRYSERWGFTWVLLAAVANTKFTMLIIAQWLINRQFLQDGIEEMISILVINSLSNVLCDWLFSYSYRWIWSNMYFLIYLKSVLFILN